tara:strand:+ start:43718 stop:45298 length:1581 start_codon:yes stop_codon:yes gene_type:complete
MRIQKFVLPSLLALAPLATWAEVSLASIYTDNMVLQSGVPLTIWGEATDGEIVDVAVAGHSEQTQAIDGKWRVVLEPLEATTDPIEFLVEGPDQVLTLQNVVVGDVWICGGQSNMVWPLGKSHKGKSEIWQANHPSLRLFEVPTRRSFEKEDAMKGTWKPCTPKTARNFSAVGYYFGVDLQKALGDVPIGIIGVSYSGTAAQAWSSLEALRTEPSLQHYAAIADYSPESVEELTEQYFAVVEPKYRAALKQYKEDRANKVRPRPVRPAKVRPPASDPNLPSVLYNGMIHPLVPFPIKGLVWYQGNSNSRTKEDAIEYATLLPNLFHDLRERWGVGDFPIVYVQHAGWRPGRSLPFLFEAQRLTLRERNVAMVTTTDLGERSNVHPANKETVGERVAIAALGLAYGQEDLYMGPMYRNSLAERGRIQVSFDYAAGLKIGQPPVMLEGSPQPPSDRLAGFEIAGSDGVFKEAEATIAGSEVIVWSDEVSAPKYVRYGWSSWPEVNLYNAADLPASPFTSLDYREIEDR